MFRYAYVELVVAGLIEMLVTKQYARDAIARDEAITAGKIGRTT